MGLRESLETGTIKDLAIREAITATSTETVADAIAKMREKKLGCVIVVDADNKPVGMFTEAMLRHELLGNPGIVGSTLESAMATKFPWVELGDSVSTLLDAMQTNKTRFACVVDADGKVAGLTGQKGLMEFVAEVFPQQVLVQRIGGTPYAQKREGA